MSLDEGAPSGPWLGVLTDTGTDLSFPWFGFDLVGPNWGFRNRVLDDHLMYLVTDGALVGEIEDAPFQLEPGNHLWMQPRVRHTFALRPGADRPTLYFVRFRLAASGVERDPDQQALGTRTHQVWEEAWDLRSLMDELVDELGTRLSFRDTRLRALLVAICAAALRQGEQDIAPAVNGTLTRSQRRLIEGHVRADPEHRTTPTELANLVGLSPDYFTRLFTRTFGTPPRVWLVQERLDRAARALSESTRNVSEIARAVGYDDAAAFSHQFRQRFGVSPRHYRRPR